MSADENDVGYCRPPKSGQFRKGRSGNPKGRPPKAKVAPPARGSTNHPTRQLLREEAERMIAITDATGRHMLSTRQAVVRAVFVKAIQGGPLAQRTALQLLAEEEERYHREREATFDFWRNYQDEGRAKIKAAEQAGREPPDLLPHPDDISLDWSALTVRFLGAVDEQMREEQDLSRRLIDLAFEMSIYLDEQAFVPGPNDSRDAEVGVYMLIHVWASLVVPPRLHSPPSAQEKLILERSSLGRGAWGEDLKARCAAVGLPFIRWRPNRRVPTIPLARVGIKWTGRHACTASSARRTKRRRATSGKTATHGEARRE
jgi:hypothetical protein